MVRTKGLSIKANFLLSLLRWHQGRNDYCWPGQETLAEEMGCEVRTVQRAIAELVAAGKVEVERQKDRSNWYYVTPATGDDNPVITITTRRSSPVTTTL